MRALKLRGRSFPCSWHGRFVYFFHVASTILSVVNQKGGVGKTTTAVNVSSFLAEIGFKTLLVDMDPQANATSGVGIRQEKLGKTIYDVLINSESISGALYPTPFDGLHLLPASKELAGAEIELVDMVSRETRLKDQLSVARDYYDFILIDCPPSLGLLTLNALSASDKALVPLQCEYFALEGLAGLLNTIDLIKESLNPDLDILGIALTMLDKRTAINRLVEENARAYFKALVFDTVIPRNTRLTEAPSHGLPIALYNPLSKGAVAYLNLTKEVIHRAKS